MKSKFNIKQSGFTLIELMIVVAIIGVLIAIAFPEYRDYTRRTYIVEGLTLAGELKQRVTTYHAEHGKFPKAFDQNTGELSDVMNIPSSPIPGMTSKHIPMVPLNGQSVIAAGIMDGTIYLYFNKKASLVGKSELELPLRPYAMPGGQILWKCGLQAWLPEPNAIESGSIPLSQQGNNKVDPNIVPAVCR